MIDAVYRAESLGVLATLIRLRGDSELAEEALHDAFAAAERTLSIETRTCMSLSWLGRSLHLLPIDQLTRRFRGKQS